MKARFIFIVRYFIFWVGLFVTAKLAFMLYQHSQSFQLPFITWFGIFFHGIRLDLSTAGYFTLFPAILFMLTSFFNFKPAWYLINTYTFIVLLVILLITLTDLEIYKYWGVRLDNGPLRFLGKPKETLASTNVITLIIYFLSFGVLLWLLFRIYLRLVAAVLKNTGKAGFKGVIVSAFMAAFLFLPIRGSIGVSPVNIGTVYFSKVAFANHAAVNVIWNFGHSMLERKETRNPYIFNNTKDYGFRLQKLYQSPDSTASILKNTRPNIILIILESFSAKLIEPLGGARGVTPRFNELSNNGVFFHHIYSSDSRTDKGLATILSGYPVLEAIPILRYPEKTQNLPFISKSLIEHGYHATFTYGGDVDFANIRSYLINGGFIKITSDVDFPMALRTGKWGVPDAYVYDRFLEDIKSDTGQWFKVMLSLTNHEPFELPVKPKFGNKTMTAKFFSSAFYADSCLGHFIDRLQASDIWNNTLVILVADHGSRLPGFDDVFAPGKHHIPLLWTGGAVANDSVVSKFGSQADIAVTLLKQLGIPSNHFVLGKNLLAPAAHSFAFYSYKNGIAMVTDTGSFGYDFTSGDLSFKNGNMDSTHIGLAKSLQQYVFDNYLKLSENK